MDWAGGEGSSPAWCGQRDSAPLPVCYRGHMVHTPDPDLNLRAEIKATMVALQSYVQMGGYRRAADVARSLSHMLERLAEMEQPNDRTRTRRIEPPPPPADGDEFLGPRLRAFRQAGRDAGMPVPPRRPPKRERRYTITEVKRELPPG